MGALSRAAQLEQDRARIREEADPVGFLSAVAKGRPVAVLDWEGEFVSAERPTMDHRITAARELLKKIAPDMKSVDVTANEGAGLTFVFETNIPLPNSQTDRVSVDGDKAVDQIVNHINHTVEDAVLADDGDD